MSGGALSFSIIVSSWKRPVWLRRCLRALSQLDYPAIEIVVVADAASLSDLDTSDIKAVPFDEANISRARNAGVRASSGDVCAFIDDDAVPEPMWLAHLAEAFRKTGADAAVGYVRGRNGISFQSRVSSVDREAETHVEPEGGEAPFIPTLQSGRALKLVGTNMAVRRDAMMRIGGFNEMYRYFLEDTEFSLRLATAGMSAAAAPLAEVHHAFAPSPRRTRLRTPVDLTDIGRSSALFLRSYAPDVLDEVRLRIWRRERNRMVQHMVLGACEPCDVERTLDSLADGWLEGLATDLAEPPSIGPRDRPFKPIPVLPAGHVERRSRFLFNRRAALRRAEADAELGNRVSLFSFSLTPVRHRLRYTEGGVWFQTGGQFGRSDRNRGLFKWCRFAERLKEESLRVAKSRGLREN